MICMNSRLKVGLISICGIQLTLHESKMSPSGKFKLQGIFPAQEKLLLQ